ncbi:unnamed protein product [Cylicostephanus goldi]|uniref:SGNH hydrolase-type esterase domain-containing protein n=1 Tax=Cylicostephanus goldi TaxID=71465 RepID=A0A3P6R5B0_CYLGO|nr:unnamed protein product [Cylicostephanus goldi]
MIAAPREFRCQSLIVFGDSLSDDGVEAVGESHGFTRNSNGKIWPEYVEKMLQCDEYINYAYSGAKSSIDNFYFDGWSGVSWQVQRYLENHLYFNGEPLIIFQTGGVVDYFTGEKDATTVIANIEASIENVTKTMNSGTLFVLTLLDLGSSPGVRAAEESADLQQRLGELVAETNRVSDKSPTAPDQMKSCLGEVFRIYVQLPNFGDVGPYAILNIFRKNG